MPRKSIFEKFLINYGKDWESIEVVRQVLAEQKDFTLANAFRRLNKINKDGFITQSEIKSYLDENDLKYSQEILEFIVKNLDHDEDGKISFPDFLLSIIPQVNLKDYKKTIIKIRGQFDAQDLGGPPEEVVFENFLNEEGKPLPECHHLWPRIAMNRENLRDHNHFITNLSSGTEFALKKFFISILNLHKTLYSSKGFFSDNFENLNKWQRKKNKNEGINLTQLLMNIIQARGIDSYIRKIWGNRFCYDGHIIMCIMRGLDKDMDGKINILDFVKSLSRNYDDEQKNLQVRNSNAYLIRLLMNFWIN